MDLSRNDFSQILIASITPYFLERDSFWFKDNLPKILDARKTQAFFQDNTIYCQPDQEYNFSEFLRKLDEMGYEKVLTVSEPGEFSQRGGIIDVFPVNINYGVRFEFFGNKIEKIEKLPVQVEDENAAREILKKKLKSQKIFSDIKGLKPGDYLVHLDHGVGKFLGMDKVQISPPPQRYGPQTPPRFQEYYVLEYAESDRLYVPAGLERKLSRYVGFVEPKISRLGSLIWQKTKKKIREDAEKFAKELLEIYAKREVSDRPPYLPDDEIDSQIAATFKHEETPDQIQAIEDIKKDLEKKEPMDRLICGDVGFGKTEVALRTIVRAVKSGRQAALIAPTTILANQHYENFKERLKNLPIKIASLSRLQTKREQKEIIKSLKGGRVDVVIGTHRILSSDVEFYNLGLLIIDDEQRFGVKQKEKLKKIRASLDILSLSATPIPRTLYLSLSSLKDISIIQTPPAGRVPVKTFVLPYSQKIIKNAVESELARGGQVYFLYNRVETIGGVKKFLEDLVPSARFAIAHGRLSERELLKVMADFQEKRTDVLIATTIIENGIDLPNVNTLIVADGTRLGLSQAYQIRGRIGRSHIEAFAYFLYPKKLEGLAQERLMALKEAKELGSGYRIAMKDLEIRGAGNILGREQSGNINKIGLNLYCQILSEAIERLKQEGNSSASVGK